MWLPGGSCWTFMPRNCIRFAQLLSVHARSLVGCGSELPNIYAEGLLWLCTTVAYSFQELLLLLDIYPEDLFASAKLNYVHTRTPCASAKLLDVHAEERDCLLTAAEYPEDCCLLSSSCWTSMPRIFSCWVLLPADRVEGFFVFSSR